MKTRMALLTALPVLLASPARAQTPDTMPANSWLAIPSTPMSAVTPAFDEFPGTWGVVGPASVIIAWGGAALDTSRGRLVLWGGGHADYYGNELYAFDIGQLKWSRLTDPFVNPVMDQEVNADGTPNSRHTYGGLAYIAHADRFFGQAGSLAGIGFAPCDRSWVFDFESSTWTDRAPSESPGGGAGCSAAYDPNSGKLWWGSCAGSFAGLWSYDYDGNAWTKHNEDHFSGHGIAYDTKRDLLVFAGSGEVFAYEVGSGDHSRHTWETTGGEDLVAMSAIGLDYDPVADRIVGWHGGAVYALDVETKVWTAYDPPGAPASPEQGMYGRWRYAPSVNAFVVVTGIDDDVHFFKLTDGEGIGTGTTSGAGGNGGGSSGGATTGGGANGGSASEDAAGAGADASATPEGDAGGCGCRAVSALGGSSPMAAGALLLMSLLGRRRRRSSVAIT